MLRDKNLNNQLLDEGYVVIKDSIPKQILTDINKFYTSTFSESYLQEYLDNNITHVNTAMSSNLSYKKNVYNFLLKTLSPFIEKAFNDFKISVCNFIVKYPGGDNECRVHQDISLIRETSNTTSLTLWFPLTDLNEKSAPLYVVPGTHKTLLNFIRGIDFTLKLNNYRDTLLKRSKIVLPLNAGDLMVMYPRLIHGSTSTPSDHNTRIAIGLGIIPKSEKLVIYQQTKNGLEELEMTPEILLNYNPNKKEEIKCNRTLIKEEAYKNYYKFTRKLEQNIF